MNSEQDNSLSLLRKSILFSNFTTYAVKYDSETKKFKTWKKFKYFKFASLLVSIVICLIHFYVTLLIFSNRIFSVKMGTFFYLLLEFLNVITIIIFERKYEITTLDMINRLTEMNHNSCKNFTIGFHIADFFVILQFIIHVSTITVLNYDLLFMKNYFHNWYRVIHFINSVYLDILQSLNLMRYNLTFLFLTKYFKQLNETFVKSSSLIRLKVIKTHKELCYISKMLNTTFSVILLFSIAFYFHNLVIRIFQIYYTAVFNLENLNASELIRLYLYITNITLIIYISSQCTSQVMTNENTFLISRNSILFVGQLHETSNL
jgi:hypothetical protein